MRPSVKNARKRAQRKREADAAMLGAMFLDCWVDRSATMAWDPGTMAALDKPMLSAMARELREGIQAAARKL